MATTILQHTDPQIPHCSTSSWTFVRGAAATIDRDFGFIGRHLFHGITETHVPTTTYLRFYSTTLMVQLKRSSLSWGSTIGPRRQEAHSALCGISIVTSACVSGWSRAKMLSIPARRYCSSITGRDLVHDRSSWNECILTSAACQ